MFCTATKRISLGVNPTLISPSFLFLLLLPALGVLFPRKFDICKRESLFLPLTLAALGRLDNGYSNTSFLDANTRHNNALLFGVQFQCPLAGVEIVLESNRLTTYYHPNKQKEK
jgi:hypothetical protein